MSSSSHLLHRAIQLMQDGRQEDARRILAHLLAQDPGNLTAWRWYVSAFSEAEGKAAALRAYQRAHPSGPPTPGPPTPGPPFPAQPRPAQKSQGRAPAVLAAREKPEPESRRAPGKGFWAGWGLMLLALVCLVGAELWRLGEYEGLRLRYDRLSGEYLALRQDHLLLEAGYRAQEANLHDLLSRHALLEAGYSRLGEEHAALQAEHESLLMDFNILQLEHANLEGQHQDLLSKAIQPPFIFIHQRIVEMSFYRMDGSLWKWTLPFDGLESAIQRGQRTRSSLSSVYLQTSAGVQFTSSDYRVFVDPDPFREVIANLYAQSASADAFIRDAWYIVTQLNDYAEDEGDIPRYPSETLVAGGGDCEDTAILLASLIRAAPVDWQVDLVYMDSDNLLDPQTVNHMIVHINTGERDYLIETTGDLVMEPYSQGVSGWYFEV